MQVIMFNESEIYEIAEQVAINEGFNKENINYRPIIYNNTLYIVLHYTVKGKTVFSQELALKSDERIFKILAVSLGKKYLVKKDYLEFDIIKAIFDQRYPIGTI